MLWCAYDMHIMWYCDRMATTNTFQRLRWPPTIEHIIHACTKCICTHSVAMGSATIATGLDIAADMCGGEDVIKVTQNQALWHIQIGLVNIKIRTNRATICSIIHYTNVLWWTIGCVSTFPPMGDLLAPWLGCWGSRSLLWRKGRTWLVGRCVSVTVKTM